MEMMSLSFPAPSTTKHVISSSGVRFLASRVKARPPKKINFSSAHPKLISILCSSSLPWESSPTYASPDETTIIPKGDDVIQSIRSEDPADFPILEKEVNFLDGNKQSVLQRSLRWPMWLFGPSILLVTGMLPTLFLPLSSVFVGPNTAGLLSLVGLDCIFNIGAALFLLMADSCAKPNRPTYSAYSQVPLSYKIWNGFASLVGFIVPLVMFLCSYKGIVEPQISFITFAVLFGPYLLLLFVQTLTEMLTWHWKSPVWLVIPVVYESYRVLQLMRGLKLGIDIAAAEWAVTCIRGLVSWWVLVLGVQVMRIAWFAGYASQSRKTSQVS